MNIEAPKLPLLQQREIEARLVGPLMRAFAAELGQERTVAILRQVIGELARQGGADLARSLGEQSLEAFSRTLDRWRENGALEIDLIEQSTERLSFNVVRCRYAEMYHALGLAELGASLSCQRDFALAEGFSPEIRLVRTQTGNDRLAGLTRRVSLAERSSRRTGTESPGGWPIAPAGCLREPIRLFGEKSAQFAVPTGLVLEAGSARQ